MVFGTTRPSLNSRTVNLRATATGGKQFPLAAGVLADLRTNHAGEVGAVCIYQGVLAVTRDPDLRTFSKRHLTTERRHLDLINAWLPSNEQSKLSPLWCLAGWVTGALPALIGPQHVYSTIEAVEQFVDGHYQRQIQALATEPTLQALRMTLHACREDEVAHREEAAEARGSAPMSRALRVWCHAVTLGSRLAVGVSRHI